MKIIGYRKLWFSLSALVVVASIVLLGVFGLRLGIDFTGGSLLEAKYTEIELPVLDDIRFKIEEEGFENVRVQATGDNGVLLRMRDVTEEEHQSILVMLNSFGGEEAAVEEDIPEITVGEDGTAEIVIDESSLGNKGLKYSHIEELRFESIGPVIGNELKRKALYAILVVVIAIILFIAWSFRKVSEPVSSWKYGVIAVIALIHDVVITFGVFAVLGKYLGVEIDLAFVAAALTVLGYSVNDTIVVFDRIRENLAQHLGSNFKQTLEMSVHQTVVRSLNTSFTTLLVLFALFMFGGDSIKWFVLALLVGVLVGTYSSIFLASPLLYTWERFGKRR
ncbi:MAG: protein translocase subunit SecF [Candidatus Jacksonbacteria bacterium]|jgi:preprotein translocase subunit SecF|nr:protein translocase subunit SecF [Candidatus Jacksonbacteria bacterium]MBT6301454.1 protein translocase subunit SecF [Candidatus Jacksonbacteria bacterium]MBT6757754.1 protein translocase subunit SecF [Candidatus Jacksonbacteria bacterium]MBT6955469.1 protein translocase subunit SecF [Candidatus Jacksonbacteria bacterium]MBT7008299.1 protein translocase subunit SecF [Candidatus Jacksonbacteria bacterium]